MKHICLAVLAVVILALSAFTAIPATSWKIADGFSIRFTSEDPSGTFTKFGGDIVFDPSHLETASFNVVVDAASISTGNGMKNRHARSEEWLDTERYPEIRFRSERFEQKGEGFEVTGTLALHGVSRRIAIPFTFRENTFAGTFTVNRTDYSIGKTTGMANKVSKNLVIDFSVPVTPR
jgi:polyisoprenoid-binding protein YceI